MAQIPIINVQAKASRKINIRIGYLSDTVGYMMGETKQSYPIATLWHLPSGLTLPDREKPFAVSVSEDLDGKLSLPFNTSSVLDAIQIGDSGERCLPTWEYENVPGHLYLSIALQKPTVADITVFYPEADMTTEAKSLDTLFLPLHPENEDEIKRMVEQHQARFLVFE